MQCRDWADLLTITCGVPEAIISLDCASQRNFHRRRVHGSNSPCHIDAGIVAHLKQAGRPTMCRDTTQHPSLDVANLIKGSPAVRFYAGCPISLPGSDEIIGALAILDSRPRPDLDWEVIQEVLLLVGRQVAETFSLRRQLQGHWQRTQDLIAQVSHELKTPIGGILGMASLLHDRLHEDVEAGEALRAISASAEFNLQTLNDLLDFARLDAGKVELESLAFDLRECVESTLAMLPVPCAQPSVRVSYAMPQDIKLIGDPHRLKQILLNLLTNALKFTSHGSVTLSARLADPPQHHVPSGHHVILFQIRDTGLGISPENADRLFQPFSQGDASTSRVYGGTGLGLAISRRLCEAMGGTMGLESALGDGTTLSFTILAPSEALPPPADLAGRAVRVVDPQPQRGEELRLHCASLGVEADCLPTLAHCQGAGQDPDLILLAAEAVGEGPPPPTPWAVIGPAPSTLPIGWAPPAFALRAHPLLQRPLLGRLRELWHAPLKTATSSADPPSFASEYEGVTVLVVDDAEINQKVLCGLLQRLGCSTDTANNGLEALQAVAAKPYDVVVMDLEMPIMNGFEACRALKAQARCPYLVAATATPLGAVRGKCNKLGIDDVVEKPIRLATMKQVLERFSTRTLYDDDLDEENFSFGPDTSLENTPRDDLSSECYGSLSGFRLLSSLRTSRPSRSLAHSPPLTPAPPPGRPGRGTALTPQPPSRHTGRRSSIFHPAIMKRSSM